MDGIRLICILGKRRLVSIHYTMLENERFVKSSRFSLTYVENGTNSSSWTVDYPRASCIVIIIVWIIWRWDVSQWSSGNCGSAAGLCGSCKRVNPWKCLSMFVTSLRNSCQEWFRNWNKIMFFHHLNRKSRLQKNLNGNAHCSIRRFRSESRIWLS